MNLPKIKAEFILDANGKPQGRSSGDYKIRISLAGAPEDSHRVTYHLDDSYYDAIRDVNDRSTGFAEELTSYGDYEVKASIRVKDRAILTSRGLADALREAHAESTDPTVQKALRDISDN